MVTDIDSRYEIAYTDMPSPLGTLWIAASEKGLVRVSFDEEEDGFCDDLGASLGLIPVHAPEALQTYVVRFGEYFAGTRTAFEMQVDLHGRASPFQRAVLEEVGSIPFGEVRSYGDIARAVGHPGASRAVGSVMATNPISLVIPCHRVIRSDGTPGEYARGPRRSEGRRRRMLLLSLEGVTFPPTPAS
jgi:methylated-DNA-[protein]-cysteine S-methyltransferase